MYRRMKSHRSTFQFVFLLICIRSPQDSVSKPATDVPGSTTSIQLSNDNATEINALGHIDATDKKHKTAALSAFNKAPSVESADEQNKILDEHVFRASYARKMMTYMNQSVDPCVDFYEYACGNWKNVIEKRQSTHKRNNLLDIEYQLGDAVEQLLQKSADTLELDYASEYKLAQQFYQNCLAASLYPMQKSEEYLSAIKSIGGFPAVEVSWDEDQFSWFNMSAHLSNYGISGLLREEIIPQFPYPPFFKVPELGFDYIAQSDNIAANGSRAYELNEKRMREYLVTYGVSESQITQIINDVFKFWSAVLKLIDQFSGDWVECNLQEAEDEASQFKQWDDYFEIAWPGANFSPIDIECPCDFFFVELDKIVRKHKNAAANYLAMKFLYHMDAKLRAPGFQKEYCVSKLQSSLAYLINKLYLDEYFITDVRIEIDNIVQEIRKSLRHTLQEVDWLDETTRMEALLKESTMISRIGYFEDKEMTDRLIRAMSKLSFVEDNYEQNNINLKKFMIFMKRYNGLHNQVISNETKPLELLVGITVNGFYYNIDNSINVMAGLLHPPAYHKAWPNSLKFGTIGYLIGHELSHGFDSIGANFDSTGDERNWWTKKSERVFKERGNCYADHYSNYSIPQIKRKVNGRYTLDENIADGGGLQEALSTYRRRIKELSKVMELSVLMKEEQMPGLDLSPEQLFFLGFAQVWCAAYEEEHFLEELNADHTIDKYRVLGAVTNIEDFSKVYSCPLGSEMNPAAEKCRLW